MKELSPARLPSSYQRLKELQKEFDDYQQAAFPHRSSRFFSLELCGEAGELANLEKKEWKGVAVPSEAIAEEAADAAIALLNYANSRGIDLAEEIQKKMSKIDAKRLSK